MSTSEAPTPSMTGTGTATGRNPTYAPFIVILILAISTASAIIYATDFVEIANNWSEHRCKTHIMPIAGTFGYDVNENFQFCLQQIIAESTKSTTAPFAQGLSGFGGVLGNLMESANSIRLSLATLTGGIIKIVSEFKSRMTALMGRIKLSATRMKALMFRLYGTLFSVMYMALSAQTGIMNFGETFIFKFMSKFGGGEGFKGGGAFFCFAPDTVVILENMSETRIQTIQLGDILYGGSVVEAMIQCPISTGPIYEIYGIRVSGEHKIWSTKEGQFIKVSAHPDAALSTMEPGHLWTLITSNREIPVKGSTGHVRFADWQETPPILATTIAWNKIAYGLLNRDEPKYTPSQIYEGPCLEGSVYVYKYQSGLTPILNIEVGDWIYDRKGWTKVLGKCRRLASSGIGHKGQRMTDGNWVLHKDSTWQHPSQKSNPGKWTGYQLITESGSFMVNIGLKQYIVRDFTEVGSENLQEVFKLEDAAR